MSKRVVCFGEALWDCLPGGIFLGGAPLNVAFHLRQLGQDPLLVSAVGCDWPGMLIRQRLREAELEARGVVTVPAYQTGHVVAQVRRRQSPVYSIANEAAWDAIPPPSAKLTAGAAAIVFGSLAQRSKKNRHSLRVLFERHPAAWRIFDVNLRRPHTPLPRVGDLMKGVHLLKVNRDELDSLASRRGGVVEEKARRLQDKSGANLVCVTLGSGGAGLLVQGQWFQTYGRPVRVKNTVGAGDAFLATLLAGLMNGQKSYPAILAQACRTAEFTASHDSATPILPTSLRAG